MESMSTLRKAIYTAIFTAISTVISIAISTAISTACNICRPRARGFSMKKTVVWEREGRGEAHYYMSK